MNQRLLAPVSVVLAFDHKRRSASPKLLIWEGRKLVITKVGMHYPNRIGRTLYHIFSVLSDDMYYKLVLNTDTLSWTLEEISDGQPD
jgi:hypothetical protein